MSTATAAVNANVALSPVPSQKPSVATASAMTTGTKTPETRSARRCTGALPVCAVLDEPGDLRERGVGADARRAHDEAAAGVDRRAGDVVAGRDLDRHRLAGEHAAVDGRGALLDDAVGGDLLAGADDEAVADRELLDGHAALGRRRRRGRATSLAPELEQRLQRGAGAALRARLEVAPREDERRDDRGGLEVDLVGAAAALGMSVEGHPHVVHARRRRGTARRATTARPRATPREMSVSIVAAPWRRFAQAARWNGQAPHRTTGVARASDEPLPVVELQRRDHRDQQHGQRQDRGDDEPAAQRARSRRARPPAARRPARRAGSVAR